ncbi:hypothetical protein FCOIX_11522 [Fusarium coicis]|nr:hypothetical protein FCOIX_11522 [Fusarium coicis]
MLRDGYTHPLTYRETIKSGETCALCRLMICSTGKLSANLESYKMHYQEEKITSGLSPVVERLKPLIEVHWSTNQYICDLENNWEARKGNFNDGETIQITAPADSLYGAHGFVPLTDVEPASSERNYRLLRKWLSTCMASHGGCRASQYMTDKSAQEITALPTRVIDIGDLKEHRSKPRLFISHKASGQYIALSHRWSKSTATKLKGENLSEYQKEIPVNDMPSTFHDTIEVTRQLGFRYLWIDSLCIIQDDESDWSQESRKMGTIFEEASCTIAAVDSVDDVGVDHGLFLPRDTDPLSFKLTIPYKKEPLGNLSQRVFKINTAVYVWKTRWLREIPTMESCDKNTITIRPRILSSWRRIPRSSWHKRGWVLQERLLSRRLIYYTKDKLSWSCLTESGEEEGGDPTAADRLPLIPMCRGSDRSIFSIWESIISDYQRCQLTFSKDRLAAIRGIAARLEAQFSCKIYAGILSQPLGDSAENLLWYASKAPLGTFNEFHAPSWTWVAFDGEIPFFMPTPCGTSELLIDRLDFKIHNQCHTLVPDIGIPRFDELGNMVRVPYNPPVLDHTEILQDECGCIIGFFIPDLEEELEQALGPAWATERHYRDHRTP